MRPCSVACPSTPKKVKSGGIRGLSYEPRRIQLLSPYRTVLDSLFRQWKLLSVSCLVSVRSRQKSAVV